MKLTEKLIVKPGSKFKLADWDPADTRGFKKKQAKSSLQENSARLAELQYLLYAEQQRALLIVLQAMDAGGKDGVIRRVMHAVNPQGCRVTPFKVPSSRERSHDFLWRIHREVPPRGYIGIFNRSHYEDVLVARVHELAPKPVWSKRYKHINDFEQMLADNDVTILKFFLHISSDEQKKRFEQRLQDPAKNWKASPADFAERKFWDSYMSAYQDALANCSTEWAPWFVIPADRKWFRNLAVSQIIVETLENMKLNYPKASFDLSKVVVA